MPTLNGKDLGLLPTMGVGSYCLSFVDCSRRAACAPRW
jgi:hypothetical protein